MQTYWSWSGLQMTLGYSYHHWHQIDNVPQTAMTGAVLWSLIVTMWHADCTGNTRQQHKMTTIQKAVRANVYKSRKITLTRLTLTILVAFSDLCSLTYGWSAHSDNRCVSDRLPAASSRGWRLWNQGAFTCSVFIWAGDELKVCLHLW